MNPNSIYNELDKQLYRPQTSDVVGSVSSSALDPVNFDVQPENISSGSTNANTTMVSGSQQSPNFVSGAGGTGWKFDAKGNLEANNGNFRGDITGASGTFSGNISGGSIDIGGDDATSAHIDTAGNFWLGASVANKATAPARISNAGVGVFSDITITGGAISGVPISGIPNSTVTDISLLEKTHNIVFSVTDADTIAWSTGTIAFSNGRAFSISAGNTGNMTALTYIYLDPAVSTTVLQVTTTYSTAMGANKSLLGTAQNHTVTASFIPYGAGQPLIDGSNIGALSIVAAQIAASTITSNKLSVSQLSAISADLGSITAGSISINSGVAGITSTGAATFKSIQVGGSTIQYTFNDSGIFSFGDGSDGDVTISANTTLTTDKYYSNLTVNNGAILNPGGYRIFVKNTLTLSGNGCIKRNGNDADGSLAGKAGGAALADGYLKGSLAGANGGDGGLDGDFNGKNGSNGVNTTNSLGSNASASGNGGLSTEGGRTAGVTGTSGTVTASNTKLIANWHLATLLDVGATGSTVKYDNSASSGGGGGGAAAFGSPTAGGGNGGGAGSAGGIVAIYARIISIAAGSIISANGGAGYNGANGGTGGGANFGGGGGGGAGGNGGIIILVYNQLANSGSITVTGGVKGNKGLKGGVGAQDGTDGTVGSAGVIYQFNISL